MHNYRQFSNVIKELSPNKTMYWSMQNGVKLTPPFIFLDVISDDISGMGEHSSGTSEQVTGDFLGDYSENREVTIRVSFYGTFTDSSYQDCRYLMALMRTFKGRSALYRNGFSLASISPLRRVDVSGDNVAYINNYFEISLRYKSINQVELDPVEEVEVTHILKVGNSLENPDDELTITGTNIYT